MMKKYTASPVSNNVETESVSQYIQEGVQTVTNNKKENDPNTEGKETDEEVCSYYI